jgi:flagellar motility protein MotE (MotC chaperone)
VTNIRLLPVVVLAVAALLVLKTLGLVTNGSYVLTGVSVARASGASAEGGAGTTEADATVTPVGEPTLEDTSPTLSDNAPTLGEPAADAAAAGGHGAPAAEAESTESAAPAPEAAVPGPASATNCVVSDATITEGGEVILQGGSTELAGGGGAHAEPSVAEDGDAGAHAAEEGTPVAVPEGSFAALMEADCLPSGDAVPMELTAGGQVAPLTSADGVSATEQQLLARLTERREELQKYEEDLALRASIVDAAERRIEERAATLEALEAQISTLVDQREQMETGQFAGIVAMYETMKPKDAANIFNNLEMAVLLRVAKTMSPRKMAPILAEMEAVRAQELTVQMAALADRPAAEMTTEDLAALPQIVGQ